MKRLSIRVKDEDPQIKSWLEQQNNVSASLRLLILQAARLTSQDYVMHCASQVGTPPEQVSGKPLLVKAIVEPEIVETDPDDLLEEEPVTLHQPTVETVAEREIEPVVVDESIQTPLIEEREPVVEQKGAPIVESPDSNDAMNDGEDDGDDLTSRLLSDRRRPSRHTGGMVGSSVEDVMISASRTN